MEKKVNSEPASAALPQKPYEVEGYFVNYILENCKELVPVSFYRQALHQAGLARFEPEIPPVSLELVAHFMEVSNFIAKIYSIMGDEVYPLFCKNLGTKLAQITVSSPTWQELRPQMEVIAANSQLSMAEKLSTTLKLLATTPKLSNINTKLEGTSIMVKVPLCIYCQAIKTEKMICFTRMNHFLGLYKWLWKVPFKAEQTQSVARGDPFCGFIFTPIV